MIAKGYRIAAQAHSRRTRCWKNRCNSSLLGACQGEHDLMLRPAFRDDSTGVVYPSCFTDGRPAPVHVADSLPDSAVLKRAPDGRVAALKQTVVAGFSLGARFYTREEAVAVRERTHANTGFVTTWHLGHRFVFCSTHPARALDECSEVSAAES
ncbi:MAG: hypothetical protein WAN46_09830 [Gammaproteobacteria bacterium]|jgi:hypothetical protein